MSSSLKDIIKAFEATPEAQGKPASECDMVRLCPLSLETPLPPIAKLDATLATLKNCKHLRLSTNYIDKLVGLNNLASIEILSLGRNKLKSLAGITDVADTLQQLWVSYNKIASLAGTEKLPHLTALFASNNQIDSWAEVDRLAACSKLRDLNLFGNPLCTKMESYDDYKIEVLKRLPNIKSLDGIAILDEDRERARG